MTDPEIFDLAEGDLRDLNARLHALTAESAQCWRIMNPRGGHAIACGLNAPVTVEIHGHVGYFCAGMNQRARVTIHGNCGQGVAENMMSGEVRVHGNASQSAGATGRGGLLVIQGNAAARCGISMKGIDIVVGGSVGHMTAFMAQAGNLVVCGDAGSALGDSIYEANIYVRGRAGDLGSDCEEKEMNHEDRERVAALLERARISANPDDFRHYGSARKLYHFHVDQASQY